MYITAFMNGSKNKASFLFACGCQREYKRIECMNTNEGINRYKTAKY